MLYRLKKKIDPTSSADLDDVFVTKKRLNSLGLYNIPDYGLTPWPDKLLFDGIKQYQKQNGLRSDGIMKPSGETELHMLSSDIPDRSPTLWCTQCGAPHSGVYSPKICHNCWDKGFR